MNMPIQKKALARRGVSRMVLLFPIQIRGSWHICKANRYRRTLRVTTIITNSCTHDDKKNVAKAAFDLERWNDSILESYTWRSKKWCTGLFHLRAHSSKLTQFHQSS